MGTVLVAGAAGFIGGKVSEMLLGQDFTVIGVDNLNGYYDAKLKLWRLEQLRGHGNFYFYQVDIENFDALRIIYDLFRPDAVINEAAQAGVRYSLENPHVYVSTNVGGSLNLLELCREYEVKKYVLASTSSLYAGQEMPFKEDSPVNRPISPYAASKKSAEAMAYSYHHLYGLDVTVLRYFTVYGPAGRPDMSYFRFIRRIMDGKPIEIFGDGSQSRDFTYVDDIAAGTVKALKTAGFETFNLGGSSPVKLSQMLGLIEEYTGKRAQIEYRYFHRSDMKDTWADIGKAKKILGWQPEVTLEEGIKRTVEWSGENMKWLQYVDL